MLGLHSLLDAWNGTKEIFLSITQCSHFASDVCEACFRLFSLVDLKCNHGIYFCSDETLHPILDFLLLENILQLSFLLSGFDGKVDFVEKFVNFDP